uniref:Uncharacterized protein n=1 Tax=Timema douglasi TaxID=61478 RepID=A0A7R8Z8W0_TIMDO|nr:unnamed protein product [Timema douglasi]
MSNALPCVIEREAAVMRANSWLYHYYMVQSKLQYGLAYEAHTASRMAAAAAAVYYHHPPPPPQPTMSPYPHQHQETTPLGYPTIPHHNGSQQHAPSPGYPEQHHAPGYRYARRTEPEPVDYSLHSAQVCQVPPGEEARTPPHHQHHQHHKRKTPNVKLEYLKNSAPVSPQSSPSSELIMDLDRGGGGGGGTALLTASPAVALSQQALSRPRVLVKAVSMDPADLSPYATTTPPTPTGTPGGMHQPLHPAFTFDWTCAAAEQYVPIMPGHLGAPRSIAQDEEPCFPMVSWPAEHRLFPLQPPPPPRLPQAHPNVMIRVGNTDAAQEQSPAKDARDGGSL